MSNLIKYQFVDLKPSDAVVINHNEKKDNFIPFGKSGGISIETIGQQEAEKAITLLHKEEVQDSPSISEEEFQKSKEEAEFLVEEAKREAQQLHEEAARQIQKEMQRAVEEGRNQGYQDGWSRAEQEIARKEKEIDDTARNQKRELEEYVDGIEKKYVDVLIALLQKLTGVLIEYRDDLMLYLIRTTVQDLEPSDYYCVRVSKEDIYEVESNKEQIIQELGQNVNLELVEEKGLEKGQCVIETQSQMVDCGFQTQLDTLIRDLKMLVHS